jgi:SAM-dependent methyltransferase
MTSYGLAYRLGFTPWERYATTAAGSIAARLDREETGRSRPLGRALDLGCGRGLYTRELSRRGWDAVGVDSVPRAVEEARASGTPGTTFVVGDVTELPSLALGTFDFFLDVGCFQGLSSAQRLAVGHGVSAAANPDATLLLLAFQRSRIASVIGGVTRDEVEAAFEGWETVSVEAAETAGLGWPMSRTAPQWYRLRLTGPRRP